jgi:CHAT domain-containing protein
VGIASDLFITLSRHEKMRKDSEAAARYAREAISLASERLRTVGTGASPQTIVEIADQQRESAELLGNALFETGGRGKGAVELAFETLQRAFVNSASVAMGFRAFESILGDWGEQGFANDWSNTRIALLDMDRQLQRASDADTINRLARKREDAWQQLIDVEGQILSEDPALFDLLRPSPLALHEARSLLGPGEAALLFVPSEFGTHAMAVTSEGLEWHRSDMTADEVADAVNSLRASLDQAPQEGGGYAASFDRKLSHRLYTELLAPLEGALEGKDHLFVASGGALTSLPLAVLVTEPPVGDDTDPQALRDTAWLDKKFALVQIPSLQSLQFLRQMQQSGDSDAVRQPFIGFGDPDLEGRYVPGERRSGAGYSEVTSGSAGTDGTVLADVDRLRALPKLTATSGELTQMANALLSDLRLGERRSFIVTEGRATEAAVKEADLSNTRVLAFATHGLLAGQEGAAEPGLVFTPPKTQEEASVLDDGLLTASEITALDLNAEWVILSACNTAAGGEPGAPGLSGLARAFFYAGAKSLLASHWPVLDEVAPRISVQTLKPTPANDNENAEQLAQLTRAQSFARAVNLLRSDTEQPDYAHPAAWAPFVLVGDK